MRTTERRVPLYLMMILGLLATMLAVPAAADDHIPPPTGSAANQEANWEKWGLDNFGEEWECTKFGQSTEFIVPPPADGYVWRLLIIKSGSDQSVTQPNELHWDPVVGQAYTHSETNDVSHAILCAMEAPRTGAILLEKVGFGGDPLTAADGVEFTIYDADDNAIPMPETSTPGTFCAEDLDFGTYTIRETGVPDGYLPLEDITGVVVDDDGDCDDPSIAYAGYDAIVNAAAPGDVIIEKIDGEGAPLAGATFNLSSSDTGYDEDCTTDATGVCSFTDVPAGLDYVLDETALPAGYTMGAVTLNGDPITLPHTFDITPYTDLEFLFVVENLEAGAWCSPGFWRNNPLAVAETGVDMNQLYSDLFAPVSPSNKAIKDGASADPTLQQVLDNPQWYGGGAFNNVGDLLSTAHPDVAFTGERVEDSCPLSADASGVRG